MLHPRLFILSSCEGFCAVLRVSRGMAEQRMLSTGLAAAACFALCAAFFRIESSHYGVIGAIAMVGIIILAGVSNAGLIVSREHNSGGGGRAS